MVNELLLHRARNGDASAFEQLVTPHEALVWRVCWHYMNQMEDAQDAAQETMLKAWRSIADFRGDAKLETWLYRLAVNCCLDALRKKKVRAAESVDALHEGGFEPVDPEPQPEERLLQGEGHQELRQALRQLPDEQRTALILSAVEGRSYEEIADITGTAMGTVKSRINRARRSLSALLGRGEQSGKANVQESGRRAKA